MKSNVKRNFLSGKNWSRLAQMLLVVMVLSCMIPLVMALIAIQLFNNLRYGKSQDKISILGERVNICFYQMLSFLTYNSNTKPFPFALFPQIEKTPIMMNTEVLSVSSATFVEKIQQESVEIEGGGVEIDTMVVEVEDRCVDIGESCVELEAAVEEESVDIEEMVKEEIEEESIEIEEVVNEEIEEESVDINVGGKETEVLEEVNAISGLEDVKEVECKVIKHDAHVLVFNHAEPTLGMYPPKEKTKELKIEFIDFVARPEYKEQSYEEFNNEFTSALEEADYPGYEETQLIEFLKNSAVETGMEKSLVRNESLVNDAILTESVAEDDPYGLEHKSIIVPTETGENEELVPELEEPKNEEEQVLELAILDNYVNTDEMKPHFL